MPYGLNNNYAESYKTKETEKESFVCDFRCHYISRKKTIHLLEFTIIPMLECFHIYLNYDSENGVIKVRKFIILLGNHVRSEILSRT